jgi:CubicO group peptidase (beta-lactamase class C family)
MPRSILLAFVLACPCMSGFAAQAAATDTLDSALAARMEQAVAAGFSGSVLVADGTHVLFERSYGQAASPGAAPVQADTRFNLGSTGKLFTSVAIMQLVQQGRLDLDAPIGRYLPEWPVATVRERVTARQLLMHTSGLGSYWGPAFEARRAGLQRLQDYQPLLLDEPAFEPGSAWQYSNSGYMVLGLLVEALSGEDYYAYITKHVFEPAGMRDSGYFAIDGVAERVARPRVGGHDVGMPEPRGGAAGGGYSTPRDLLRFQRAIAAGTLLDAATRELMLSSVVMPAGTRAPPHGLGVLRYPVGEDLAWGHPGGAPGVGVEFWSTRDGGWTVVVMSNADEPRTMPVVDGLLGVIAGHGGPDMRLKMRGGPRRVAASPRSRD